eukprot:CAMPEP_0180678718 /NCGR_PEP_ID=MMETSP1037_2-20121125/68525_1 /TAXON_ID=632150 /ORGANISM="Azadinium spinosum, Strain 3D9" /LENGTH=48 /DNA_ID= /DNA_START= /DNA_END= /DNA_ORIENTATION=
MSRAFWPEPPMESSSSALDDSPISFMDVTSLSKGKVPAVCRALFNHLA